MYLSLIHILLNPTFSEYERSARLNNLDVINLNLDESNEFEIDLNNIKENINKFDSLFVCNPNNPNGKVKNLEKLLDIIVDNNKLLIVDETFMEFVEEEEKYSLVKYVEKYPNLFIPVSYTHLDVYKRQELDNIISNNDDRTILICSHGGTIRNIITVSYTHIDVYKRQILGIQPL